MLVELAEVSLDFEELRVVVLTVETLLMGHEVRRADYAAAVGAPEAGFVVRCTIDRHLKKPRLVANLILIKFKFQG